LQRHNIDERVSATQDKARHKAGRESMSFHLLLEGASVTIMGLVEFDSGLISDDEFLTFTSHRFIEYEGEQAHGS
jgi:hypothetical protein